LWGLSAWLIFWFALCVLAILCAVFFQFGMKPPGISGLPAILYLVVSVLLSVALSIIGGRWQSRILESKPVRVSYVVLVVMIVLGFLCLPAPFIYTYFE